MKTKTAMKYFAAAVLALTTGGAALSAKTLAVGDPAPQLQAEKWLTAAGQTSIPCTFLNDKEGHIACIGHPSDLTEGMIEDVLAENFDALNWDEAALQIEAEMEKAFSAMISKVLLLDKKFKTQLLEEKWDEAEATVEEIIAIVGADISSQDNDIARTDYRVKILMAKGDTNAAFQEVARIWEEYPQENPQMFQGMAAELLGDPSLNDDALKLVEKICNRLDTHYQKAQVKVWQNLACLARISFIKGDKEKAIQHQQEAIDVQNQYLTPDILEKFGEHAYKSNVAVQKKLQLAMESYKAGQLSEWPVW